MPKIVMPMMVAVMALAWAAPALSQDNCGGHQLLSTPRPEGSCLTLRPQVYPSPDQALRAIVFPEGSIFLVA